MGEGAGVTPSCRGYRVSSPKNVENLDTLRCILVYFNVGNWISLKMLVY